MSQPRQTFSDHERVCLQALILKYKLNKSLTISARKVAWTHLTQEFNSIKTNTKRTEAQLRKCWDNLKTRRKQAIAQGKRERMRIAGGLCLPSPPEEDSQEAIEAALLEATNKELQYVFDNDVVTVEMEHIPPGPDLIRPNTFPVVSALSTSDGATSQIKVCVTEDRVEIRPLAGSRLSDYGAPSQQASIPVKTEVEETTHRQSSGSCFSNYGAPSQTTDPKNIRAHVINEEFTLRRERYQHERERDEELHNLKMAQQGWLVKAAEETYKKAQLERESAEQILLSNRAKRELAELELANAKK